MKKKLDSKLEKVLEIHYLKSQLINEEDSKSLKFKKKKIVIGNFKLEKSDLFGNVLKGQFSAGGYKISVLDEKKDLTGVLLDENHPSYQYLSERYNNNDRFLLEKDIEKYYLNNCLTKIELGNIVLKAEKALLGTIGYTDKYAIALRDEKKNVDGKIKDEYITKELVRSLLQKDFQVSKVKYKKKGTTELVLNKSLLECAKKKFENANMSAGDHNNFFDLVIGSYNSSSSKKDNTYIIELKLASQLIKNTQKVMLLEGQIGKYNRALVEKKNYNPNNFIVVVIGTKEEQAHKNIKEAMMVTRVVKKCWFEYILCK